MREKNGKPQTSALALIDGEHYLPVTKSALEKIAQSYALKAAVFIGGTEKIADDSSLASLGVDIIKQKNAQQSVVQALEKYAPDVVIDLSDEPVLDYKKRFFLASLSLKRGVIYKGADFELHPPQLEKILTKPSIAIIGTGKRVGKTAVSAYISRLLKTKYNPVVIAMGRGGPTNPEILDGDKIELTPEVLLEQSRQGKHAASDYYEDALTSRIKTIGCRRAGGGLAGQPFISNVVEGAKIANDLDNDLVILEGSGSAIPPVRADKNILIIGAYQRDEDISDYFGPFRVMMSDLVILTMCEEPMADDQKIKEVEQAVKNINPHITVIKTLFRPKPLGDIEGKKIFVATTAKEGLDNISKHLESTYNCQVIAISNQLSNRPLLKEAINEAGDFDVMLTELKAAAVDVATSVAFDLNKKVVYMDNVPVPVDGGDLDKAILDIAFLVNTVK